MLNVPVLFSILTLGHCVYIANDQCPPNEEYLTCGSACPTNCTNLTAPPCIEQCVEGCFCSAGLVRNKNGVCVRVEQCGLAPVCGVNEEFTTCGSFCPRTCSQPTSRVCTLSCKVGCTCSEGFIRSGNGDCIPAQNCTITIPCFNRNEVFDICNGACQPTCSNPAPVCARVCVEGCVCASGYIRNDIGECVTLDDCAKLGPNAKLLSIVLDALSSILRLLPLQ